MSNKCTLVQYKFPSLSQAGFFDRKKKEELKNQQAQIQNADKSAEAEE